jgi:hypothetical protein
MEKGMKINNQLVERISGPINMRILKPSLESFYSEEEGNIQLPIILLFGDMHQSFEGICKKCYEKNDISTDEERQNCYPIYHEKFFNLFNNISTKQNQIDFFVEYDLHLDIKEFFNEKYKQFEERFKTKKNKFMILPEGDSISTYIQHLLPCLYHDSIFYDPLCNYKNLRIHFSDVRHVRDEETTSLIFSNEKNFKTKLKTGKIYLEKIFVLALDQLNFSYHFPYKIKSRKDSLLFTINHFEIDKILLSIYKDDKFDISNFTNVLFDHIQTKHSKLFKQIKKQTFKKFQDFNFWKIIFEKCCTKNLQDFFEQNKEIDLNNEKFKKFYLNHVQHFFAGTYHDIDIEIAINYKIKWINIWRDIFFKITLVFVDLYFILRCFKTPVKKNGEKDVTSNVSIAYFGDAHCKNITYVLTELLNSTISNSKQPFYYLNFQEGDFENNVFKKNHIRCLDFSKSFYDLDEQIQIHKDLRINKNSSEIIIKSAIDQAKNKISISNKIIDLIKDKELLNLITDIDGNTLSHYILQNNLQYFNKPAGFFSSESENTIDILINHKIDFNKQNIKGETPFDLLLETETNINIIKNVINYMDTITLTFSKYEKLKLLLDNHYIEILDKKLEIKSSDTKKRKIEDGAKRKKRLSKKKHKKKSKSIKKYKKKSKSIKKYKKKSFRRISL